MRQVVNNAINEYQINGQSFQNISNKCAKVNCIDGRCYFIKKTNIDIDEKYKFLDSLKIENIIYPIPNNRGNYVSKDYQGFYYVLPYVNEYKTLEELKINKFYREISTLHLNTYYRKELTPLESRKRLEDIYNYLDYKFKVIEAFVRTIEEREFDEHSILILKDYQYILNAKTLMGKLNKEIINDVKSKKVVNRSFIHNNPKLNHLINNNGQLFFISLERSKVGIPSLDMAKFYIETEDIKINHKELIDNYFSQYDDPFYYNYFYFLVMLYYIKTIVINDQDYISSQSFVYAGLSLKRFINDFQIS